MQVQFYMHDFFQSLTELGSLLDDLSVEDWVPIIPAQVSDSEKSASHFFCVGITEYFVTRQNLVLVSGKRVFHGEKLKIHC